MTPSKELISAVLGHEVKAIDTHETDEMRVKPNIIAYLAHDEDEIAFEDEINIYELQHMVKEWAYDNRYQIKSFKRIGNFKALGLWTCEVHDGLKRIWDAEHITDTEPEAIFKAGE